MGRGLPVQSPALSGPPAAPAWPPYPGGESGYSSEHHGIHVPIRAKVQRRRPVLGGAAGVAHPVARAADVCPSDTAGNGRTFGLGLRPARSLPAATEILFSPAHYPAPPLTMNSCLHPLSEPQNMNASALLGVCWAVVREEAELARAWWGSQGVPSSLSSRDSHVVSKHIMSFDRCCTRAGSREGPTPAWRSGRASWRKGLRTESCLEISQGDGASLAEGTEQLRSRAVGVRGDEKEDWW